MPLNTLKQLWRLSLGWYRWWRADVRLWLARLLVLTLVTSVIMLSSALGNSGWYEKLYVPLLTISSLGLLILSILIILNVYDLLLAIRQRQPGARLTLRLVIVFVILASLPVLVVFYFSLSFLHQRLDTWINVEVEPIVRDALQLSRATLNDRLLSALRDTRAQIKILRSLNDESSKLELTKLREQTGAHSYTLYNQDLNIVAFSSENIEQLLPYRPEQGLLRLSERPYYIGLEEPVPGKGLYAQVIIWANYTDSDDLHAKPQPRILHALYLIQRKEINELANRMEERASRYQQTAYLRDALKLSFTLVLFLVLLLSLFSAAWGALFAARKLVAPVKYLAEGTRAVAEGNYQKQLPANQIGELSFLVKSFNEMTRQLQKTHTALQASRQQSDNQLAYLEVLLERLSSGVISLDQDYKIRTCNQAAEQILHIGLLEFFGKPLLDTCANHPSLAGLCQTASSNLKHEIDEWQEQVTLFGHKGRTVLLCKGSRLPALGDEKSGYLLVFEDVTALLQGQRDAAWSEVARRLAHEIKNPLTPIRLSAERLRHKYLPTFPDKEANTLDRMTSTIIQQVENMQDMVNAFSNYARTPTMKWQQVDLNKVIEDVLNLYQTGKTQFTCRLDANVPLIDADSGRLRQVLHNLIKNALEANEQAEYIKISIATSYSQHDKIHAVELMIQDNGSGIPEDLIENIFDPYVTRKTKGTGLGLAIVKKIIQEHNGEIWVTNKPGACFNIRLPLQRTRIHGDHEATSKLDSL